MRLGEAIRAIKRDSGRGSIARHAGGSGRSVTYGYIDLATWTVKDILADWEIVPPEPEKPREWMMFQSPNGDPHCAGCDAKHALPIVKVHDADACNRLRGKA